MGLPSLSSLLSYLPTVSLSPLIPLPSNLQQRLVSFLLRKTLGSIVKGGLDSDRIEADIRDGTFAINDVEIDPQVIAPLLLSTPTLSFVSGTISNISAKVSYPLAQLGLIVSDASIVLRVRDRQEAGEWLDRSTDTLSPTSSSPTSFDRDELQESILSIAVAQDFREHESSEREEAELRASLHLPSASMTQSSDFDLPGAFGGVPSRTEDPVKGEHEVEEVETTMLAGLIERILARLHVRVQRVSVRLVWADDAREGGGGEALGKAVEEESELEVRIEEIEYLGDTNSQESPKQENVPSLRAIKITPPKVFLKLARPPLPAHTRSRSSSQSSSTSTSNSTSSSTSKEEDEELDQSVSLAESITSLPPQDSNQSESESESESESSGDENDLLALSQSIADLRTSTASLSQSSTRTRRPESSKRGLGSIEESVGSDMFESATSFVSARSNRTFHETIAAEEGTSQEETEDGEDPFTNPDTSPQPPQEAPPIAPEPKEPENPSHLIVSLGSPTTLEPLVFYLSTKSSALSSDSVSHSSRSKPSLHVTASIPSGWVVALTTTQLATLLRVARRLEAEISPSEAENPSLRATPPPSPINLSLLIKSITLILAYPDPPVPSATELENVFSQLWTSKDPSSFPLTSLKTPHLRLRVDEISLGQSSGTSSLSIGEFTISISETLSEGNSWKALPIVVSDPGLLREGSGDIGGDWVVESAGLGKDWRIKPKNSVEFGGSGGGGGTRRKSGQQREVDQGDDERKKIDAVKVTRTREGKIEVYLAPIHGFVDLMILARLEPILGVLGEAFSKDERDGASTPKFSQYRPRPAPHASVPSPFSQAQLFEDLSSSPSTSNPSTAQSTPSISVQCPLLRVDVRCPAPRKLRLEVKDQHLLRGGIVVLELEHIRVGKGAEEIVASLKEARIGIRIVGQSSKLSNFVTISSLSPADPSSVCPSLSFAPPPAPLSPSSVTCSLPLVHVKIDKKTLDHLQLFADDLSQYLNGELSRSTGFDGESSAEKERERMIGSRYFGTKSFTGSASASRRFENGLRDENSAGNEESRRGGLDGIVKMGVELDVIDLVVDFLVPTCKGGETRHLRVLASDLDVSITTLEHASDDLRVRVEVGDIRVEESTADKDSSRKVLLARTQQRDLASTSIRPLVKVGFATSSDPQTDLKESRIEIGLEGFSYFFETSQVDLAEDLALFAKAPEGAFEQVVPNELTRLRLRASNIALHVTPPNVSSRVVLSVEDASVKTDMMPDLPRTTWSIEARGARFWAVESVGDLKDPESIAATQGPLYWKANGFVSLGELENASIIAKQGNGLVLPDFELLVSNAKARLSLCADSVVAITNLIDDVLSAPCFKAKSVIPQVEPKTTITARTDTKRSTVNLLSSVDENAFERAPSIHDFAEFIEDDVPANPAYLANALSQRTKSTHKPRQSDAASRDRPGRVTENIGGETVRMLSARGLQIHDEWLAESRFDEVDLSGPASRTRLRLSNIDVSIHLHDGYDWTTTRRTIEEESKAVRRRLEKIRQLLADGQTPDATGENASVLMFGSHQLGLPPGANEMTPKDLLAAIDEELEQGGPDEDAVSTAASSWQTLAGAGSRSGTTPRKLAAAVTGKGRKRLTRSKAFAIEVNVRGLNANFDAYSSSPPPSSASSPSSSLSSSPSRIAAKIKVDVGSFDIIDNIKTSTWRKFLTEMRPSDGGLVRASGSPMAKFELETAKPSSGANTAQDEISMKIKLAPLRLYIDQDALDFLKAFGAFKAPSPVQASKNVAYAPPAPEPFFQRVEVLPVKIKLDYKPKRVDYYALKQGKTAELMNFFHFDGSEMVLRHLVVTGVSGTTTLSNLVQDIWTPDVKANQLADVISGIAPVRSVVNVGSGVANLVLLPIEQYRKDGRVVRGLQKGAQAFAKQTTLEAINVGAKLANGTQVILEQAEHVLGGHFSQRLTGETLSGQMPSGSTGGEAVLDLDDFSDEEIKKARSRYAEQPTDLRQGVQSAYRSLGDNFKEAAQTILAVPMEVYERSGNEGPVRAVVRAVPIAVLRPMIGASGAVSKALLGLRNSLDPDQQQGELEDKYKPRPDR